MPLPIDTRVRAALAALETRATKATRDGMARFAIPSDHALGVAMKDLNAVARELGRDHALALALWHTGVYEARMLTSLIADPARVTPTQMDRWCKDFDNWAIVDTMCFKLFDRTAHAWDKVEGWSTRRPEFEKRAAFALLWSLTVHDKRAPDDRFRNGLALVESEAADSRHFVKKAVNMALRAVGKRNANLRADAVEVARRLAASDYATARWVGKDALRELVRDKTS